MADQSPRKYQPSELKLAFLRALGIRPIATGLPALLALLLALGAVIIAGRSLLGPIKALLTAALSGTPPDAGTMPARAGAALLLTAAALLAVGTGGFVGWLTGNAVQTGIRSPCSGLQKPSAGHYAIPRRGPADHATRALLAAALVCLAAVTALRVLEALAALDGAQLVTPGAVWAALWRPVLYTFLPGVLALVVLDIAATRYGFMQAAGMTETEKRREVQDQEVGWLTRIRRRNVRRGGHG